jgi:crotonobetainyl-CoA:carnitine CoA-transferase CaiB-like acyl-CoA transferase
MGQNNEEIYKGLLHMTDEELARLKSEKVI